MTGPDVGPDVRWITYTELAEARGITEDSAVRLVHRHKSWRRMNGNDGRIRIAVPLAELTRTKRVSRSDVGGDIGEDVVLDVGPDIEGRFAGLADRLDLAVAALEDLANAQARTTAAEAEAASLRREALSLRQIGDQAAARIATLEATVRAGEDAERRRRQAGLWERLREAVSPRGP